MRFQSRSLLTPALANPHAGQIPILLQRRIKVGKVASASLSHAFLQALVLDNNIIEDPGKSLSIYLNTVFGFVLEFHKTTLKKKKQ